MEDKLIEYTTAVLAKEKGFNEPTVNHWERGIDGAGWGLFNSPGFILKNDELTLTYINETNDEICGEFSAPTQSLLAKWLREIHNIHIEINAETDFKYTFSIEKWNWYENEKCNRVGSLVLGKTFWDTKSNLFDTYEQAYEKGLQEALKLIK